MLNLQDQSVFWKTLFNPFKPRAEGRNRSRHLSYSILSLIVLAAGLLPSLRAYGETAQPAALAQAAAGTPHAAAPSSYRFDDGTYLYGQAEEANQIGSAYFVFESRGNQIIGAFYMPHSSFDCVHGSIDGTQLAMTVVDSYSQEPYPYSVALNQTAAIANAAGGAANEIGLEGFHSLNQLGEVDQQVLETCVSTYGDQVW